MLATNSLTEGITVSAILSGSVSGDTVQLLGPLLGSLTGSLENLLAAGVLGLIELPLDRIAEIIRALALGGLS